MKATFTFNGAASSVTGITLLDILNVDYTGEWRSLKNDDGTNTADYHNFANSVVYQAIAKKVFDTYTPISYANTCSNTDPGCSTTAADGTVTTTNDVHTVEYSNGQTGA